MTRLCLAVVPRGGVAPAIMVVLCVVAGLEAQQQQQRVERVDVSRVLIDVRVIDGTGRPILGLEPDDFHVRIGGQPVLVESALWVGGAAPRSGPIPSTVLADRPEAAPAAPSQLVVFLVQKSLEHDRLIGLLRILQESERLLSGLTPGDRVAVLSFDSHLKIWLDFTGDLDRVRTVLADEVMFRKPVAIAPGRGLSLVSRLSQEVGRKTYAIEDALRLLGEALESLPGPKSVVLIGYGFGPAMPSITVTSVLDESYAEARAALHAARAAVFSLDVTDADVHTFELGLETVAVETGGFFARTHLNARGAMDRVGHALAGHYVLFTEPPDVEPGTHRIEVELLRQEGIVLARSSYVE